jgi:hypothetical protein
MLHTLQKYCKQTHCSAAYMSQVHCDAHISAMHYDVHISVMQCDAHISVIHGDAHISAMHYDVHISVMQCDAHISAMHGDAHISTMRCDAHISAIRATQDVSSSNVVALSSNQTFICPHTYSYDSSTSQTIHADFICPYTYSYDSSYSCLSMPLYDVAVVHFVILQSSSRSGGKDMLCARSGLRSATVRVNDYHGEGWYHRLVQF